MDTTPKYVGIDVHQATIVIVVMLATGDILMKTVAVTTREAVIQFFRGLTGSIHVAFEEGTLAQWLFDIISPLVQRVVVCNERGQVKGNKADELDAKGLANRLRMNDLKPVYHSVASVGVLKHLAHAYEALVQDSTRSKLRLKALFRSEALKVKGDTIYNPKVGVERIKELSNDGARTRATGLIKQVVFQKEMVAEAQKAMVQEAKKHAAYKVLDALPFFGPVRTAQLLAIIVTPWRFRTKRQLWAMAGLAVVTWDSSENEVVKGNIQRKKRKPMTRGLNRNHNPVLKQVFMSAANDAACRKGPLKDFYDAMVERGMREEMAKLALARKIAAYTLRIWKKGEKFDPAKLTVPAKTQSLSS